VRAIHELRRGDYGPAARNLIELADHRPSFFLRESPANLLAPRNFRRVRQLMRDHARPVGGSFPEPAGRPCNPQRRRWLAASARRWKNADWRRIGFALFYCAERPKPVEFQVSPP